MCGRRAKQLFVSFFSNLNGCFAYGLKNYRSVRWYFSDLCVHSRKKKDLCAHLQYHLAMREFFNCVFLIPKWLSHAYMRWDLSNFLLKLLPQQDSIVCILI